MYSIISSIIFLLISNSSGLNAAEVSVSHNKIHCDYDQYHNPPNLLTCSACKVAHYCNRDCQKSAWKKHRPLCAHFIEMGKQRNEEDLTKCEVEQGREAYLDTGLEIVGEVNRISLDLNLSVLEGDGLFDQMLSCRPESGSSLREALKKAENIIEIKASSGNVLLPGMGYLSPYELNALLKTFPNKDIHGFDIDEKAITLSKMANPDYGKHFAVADGTKDQTWQWYKTKDIDFVVLLHPIFCDSSRPGQKLRNINAYGLKTIEYIRNEFPRAHIIVVNKVVTETNSIVAKFEEHGYKILARYDNIDTAIPSHGFFSSVIGTIPTLKPFLADTQFDIKALYAQTLKEVSWLKTALYTERCELRNHFIFIAKLDG